MPRRRPHPTAPSLALLITMGALGLVGPAACGETNAATHLVQSPEFLPEGQTKCSVSASQSKPLIVEWPSADRAELEAKAKTQVVVVRYEGCEMEVLAHCRAPGSYAYTGVTPKQDTVSIRNADELYAQVPVGAAKLEAKLERAGELTVAMTMVGRLETPQPSVAVDELEGSCTGATHVVAALTVGAFEFFAGGGAEIGAGVKVHDAGVGAKSSAVRETLTRDGSPDACGSGDPTAPPRDCSAVLRLEAVPLGMARRAAATCPDGSEWDGSTCVRTTVVTRATCPPGSSWDGAQCVAERVEAPAPAPVASAPVTSAPVEPVAPAESGVTMLGLDELRGDKNPGGGWFCFRGTMGSTRFGQCERDRIDCGVTLGQRITAGLSTKMQRCDEQPDAACFQVQRTMEEGLRTFCFPEPAMCTATHASVKRRKDTNELTDCRVYR